MKFLTTFKIFEARLLPEPMYAVWLVSGFKNFGGLFPKSMAVELKRMLEDILDPQGDDMVSISDEAIAPEPQNKKAGVVFDGNELQIYDDSEVQGEVPDDADWASKKDLFSHPGEFLDLSTTYEKDKKWYSILDAMYQVYGEELQLPSIDWSKPGDPGTEGE